MKRNGEGATLDLATNMAPGILASRRRILKKLEKKRRSRTLVIAHSNLLFGGESFQELGQEEVEHTLARIHQTPEQTPIDLILHTPGGMMFAAEMVALALKRRPGKVTVMVPYYAMSGGTLIALSANEILMDEHSVLGPLDPQIGGWPASVLLRAVQAKGAQFTQDETIMQAFVAEMALEQMKRFVHYLLCRKQDCTWEMKVADFLVSGYQLHETPIDYETLKTLNLPVKLGVPQEVYEFFDTCSFGLCARPMLVDYAMGGKR